MVEKEISSKRLFWADILRILAIYLVIVVHVTKLPDHFDVHFLGTFIMFGLAKTCVPLFIMLSGALLLGKQESYSVFYMKRFRRILVPWLFWSIFFFLFTLLILHTSVVSLQQGIKLFASIFLTRFWFLPLLALLYLLTPVMRIFVQHAKGKDILLVLTVWALGIVIIPHIHDSLAFPLHTDNGFARQVVMYSGYYLLGYYLMKYVLAKKLKVFLVCSMLVSIAGLLLATIIVQGDILPFYEYVSPFVLILSMSIFLLIFSCGKEYPKRMATTKLITYVSTISFGVIFTHEFWIEIFRLILPLHIQVMSGLHELVSALIVFIFSLLTLTIIRFVPGLRRVIS